MPTLTSLRAFYSEWQSMRSPASRILFGLPLAEVRTVGDAMERWRG